MRPKGISKEFIKYSWYFAILSPIDISRNIMPVYFYLRGYGPLKTGILYALATLVQLVLPYLIGTTYRNVSLNKVMALNNILSGLAYALCALPNRLSFGIAVCLLRCAGSVGSVYQTYCYAVFPEEERVRARAYAAGSIGSTLWDPHHINLLYSAIPAELNRQFFGSFSSLKQILTLALLPTATALAEYNISLNYGLSALLVAAALVVYWSILSSSSDATTSLSID